MIHVNARAIVQRDTPDGREIVIQWRDIPGQEAHELPGGRVEPYESFFQAVRREVLEETGLSITRVEGQDGRRVLIDPTVFQVECFQPYAVYQTLHGPVDSMGVFFLCWADGEPAVQGDLTRNVRWASLAQVQSLLETPGAFGDIDRAALLRYLQSI